jgi:hypothetical protein
MSTPKKPLEPPLRVPGEPPYRPTKVLIGPLVNKVKRIPPLRPR